MRSIICVRGCYCCYGCLRLNYLRYGFRHRCSCFCYRLSFRHCSCFYCCCSNCCCGSCPNCCCFGLNGLSCRHCSCFCYRLSSILSCSIRCHSCSMSGCYCCCANLRYGWLTSGRYFDAGCWLHWCGSAGLHCCCCVRRCCQLDGLRSHCGLYWLRWLQCADRGRYRCCVLGWSWPSVGQCCLRLRSVVCSCCCHGSPGCCVRLMTNGWLRSHRRCGSCCLHCCGWRSHCVNCLLP